MTRAASIPDVTHTRGECAVPDIHVPDLDEEPSGSTQPTGTKPAEQAKPAHGAKWLIKVGLEVLLISAGVFLGLMGEQWRERAEHREIATAALRRFRTEFRNNRDAVASVKDKHV